LQRGVIRIITTKEKLIGALQNKKLIANYLNIMFHN